MSIPRITWGTPQTPVSLSGASLRRFASTEQGDLSEVAPTGGPPVWMLVDALHYGSRSGKYPIHMANQELPGKWVGPEPSMLPPGMMPGYHVVISRQFKQSAANMVNPKPEYMGDTIYDAPLPGEAPDVFQNLNLAPNLTPATLLSLGWQDTQAVLLGVPPSKVTGMVKRAP